MTLYIETELMELKHRMVAIASVQNCSIIERFYALFSNGSAKRRKPMMTSPEKETPGARSSDQFHSNAEQQQKQ